MSRNPCFVTREEKKRKEKKKIEKKEGRDPWVSARSTGSVEVYRTPSGRDFGYRVVASSADNSAEALRAAKALALAVEDELHTDLEERSEERRHRGHDVVAVLFPPEHNERIKALAEAEEIHPSEYLRRIVAAHLDELPGSE